MAEPKQKTQEAHQDPNFSRSFTRDDYVLLCDFAMQSERYEEMIGYIKKFADGSEELSKKERKYLATAYKQTVGNKRAELRVLSAIEQKEKNNNADSESDVARYIKTFKQKVEGEL